MQTENYEFQGTEVVVLPLDEPTMSSLLTLTDKKGEGTLRSSCLKRAKIVLVGSKVTKFKPEDIIYYNFQRTIGAFILERLTDTQPDHYIVMEEHIMVKVSPKVVSLPTTEPSSILLN